ncbi:polysaccharide deacetylase family protein [Desulfovibrio ferrophilus]|uniref:Polysaccharide deacetylase n=1 Tax=Desulfovibrio ferrophilus TaxID=241368 RepID=A0A2Z6AUJ9_9BACT|nr:polysaccharide deacetylase family protein [Desulfovibrio ferrophilus]BBD06912.1 Polysaccharide deacetylase [Desulfovibrio ferrophilus]
MLKSLPVLMYHYISSWPNSIAVAPEIFESHLEAMTSAGYTGISLVEAEEYLRDGRELPKGSALITFDDGFLDNFVYAWPLLEKHGHKGTVFTVTNKIVSEQNPRPSLKDVWEGFVGMNELPQANLPGRGGSDGLRVRTDLFFSWKEARLMEASGVMSIAAHTHTHRSVFTSSSFEKLFKPGIRRRTFDRIDQNVIYGLPDFSRGAAMANEAFLPSEELYGIISSIVPQDYDSAKRFFADPAKHEDIMRRIRELPAERLGRMETPEEFQTRLRADLTTSKEILEREMGHPVSTLAWPWGEFSKEALEIAKELGFSVFFTTALGPNLPGKSADAAYRFKAKNKSAKWMLSRLGIYSKPLMARVYGTLHG